MGLSSFAESAQGYALDSKTTKITLQIAGNAPCMKLETFSGNTWLRAAQNAVA